MRLTEFYALQEDRAFYTLEPDAYGTGQLLMWEDGGDVESQGMMCEALTKGNIDKLLTALYEHCPQAQGYDEEIRELYELAINGGDTVTVNVNGAVPVDIQSRNAVNEATSENF
jgi:hypothetical protein